MCQWQARWKMPAAVSSEEMEGLLVWFVLGRGGGGGVFWSLSKDVLNQHLLVASKWLPPSCWRRKILNELLSPPTPI